MTNEPRCVALSAVNPGTNDADPRGPFHLIVAPEDYTHEELQEMLDLVMLLPLFSCGCVLVVREGVTVQRLS